MRPFDSSSPGATRRSEPTSARCQAGTVALIAGADSDEQVRARPPVEHVAERDQPAERVAVQDERPIRRDRADRDEALLEVVVELRPALDRGALAAGPAEAAQVEGVRRRCRRARAAPRRARSARSARRGRGRGASTPTARPTRPASAGSGAACRPAPRRHRSGSRRPSSRSLRHRSGAGRRATMAAMAWQEVGDRVFTRHFEFLDQQIGVVLGGKDVLVVDTRATPAPCARGRDGPPRADPQPDLDRRRHPLALGSRVRQQRVPAGADLGPRPYRRAAPRAAARRRRTELLEEIPELADDLRAVDHRPAGPHLHRSRHGHGRRSNGRARLPRPRPHGRRHLGVRAGREGPVRRRPDRERGDRRASATATRSTGRTRSSSCSRSRRARSCRATARSATTRSSWPSSRPSAGSSSSPATSRTAASTSRRRARARRSARGRRTTRSIAPSPSSGASWTSRRRAGS